ncbi:GGDEF domain-containing protein [Butyrivibrio sp. FCS014]|uniref:GGDEF domain-containing protein n=1 Tax=Butyrivibrio sp. FCS014 TaxID=1408304 RepID=UPI000465797E|nr:GGDEF domain-containing protein [Butyrivibrio sp. FCS014]
MKKKYFVSIKVKMSIGVAVICLFIGVLAVLLMNQIAEDIVANEYTSKAEQISKAVVNTLDPVRVKVLTDDVMDIYKNVDVVVPSTQWGSDAWNEYMSNYSGIEELPVFEQLRNHLRLYQDIFDVSCIYMMAFNAADHHAVYIVDAAYVDECPPGVVDSFDDGFWPDESGYIPTTITNEEVYGGLVSAGYPVIIDGDIISYLCVDISMNEIRQKENEYVFVTAAIMILVTTFVLAIALIHVNNYIITPILTLSDTAKNYCSTDSGAVHHAFERITYDNNDEMAQLINSLKQMEFGMNENIAALMDTRGALKITEEKANTMEELAIKDSLTGVWNRLAYEAEVSKLNEEILDGFTEFGISMIDLNELKTINDTYGHENGNTYIIRLSNLICDVFKRSKVFRIGGDEFAVISKNKDFRNIDKLIEDFYDRLRLMQEDSSLKPWEKASAALGFARFDESADKSVDDVFKKADRAMYDKKASMKAGNKTD